MGRSGQVRPGQVGSGRVGSGWVGMGRGILNHESLITTNESCIIVYRELTLTVVNK